MGMSRDFQVAIANGRLMLSGTSFLNRKSFYVIKDKFNLTLLTTSEDGEVSSQAKAGAAYDSQPQPTPQWLLHVRNQ